MSLRKVHNTEELSRRSVLKRLSQGTLPLIAALMCLLIILVLGAGAGITEREAPGDIVATTTPAPGKADVPNQKPSEPRYPISGYFIAGSSRDATNYKKLADIKEFGGDTVITFGTSLRPASLETIPSDCVIDGRNCASVAADSVSVNRYFTFLDGSNWNDTALKCPRDRKVTNKGQSYLLLVLPAVGSSCNSPNGEYDVVVTGGSSSSASDPSRSLAAAATKLGMKYFAGMPAPVKRKDLTYLPDLSYETTLSLFTERFLQYQASANNVGGLAGFYHHTEMPLTDSLTFDSILALYKNQNRAIKRILPTRQAIVSPYIEARVGKSGISAEEARLGTKRIAQTAEGLVLNIAVQDGMGTGKGGAFTSREAGSLVDPFAATIVGNGSWGAKYLAPNRDYYTAAAAGTVGTNAVLWANLEGMAPATKLNTCGDSLRGQTTKARIDRQLQQVANAKKVISFMWDSYFTCKGTGTPLKGQVERSLTTPIITDTSFRPGTGELQIVGFNIRGGSARVKWTGGGGQPLEKSAVASDSDATYGLRRGLNPKLEKITLSVGSTTVNASRVYSVRVINGWGVESVEFHSQLP
ncbi:hypothetical protein [Paenarthrobacter sp. NPDC091669]|uniref:hypothetical protein n=1 Tax=Paenarthrobacter sp. NPDC091669 TaxID=3364384 RepID=UPI00380BC974